MKPKQVASRSVFVEHHLAMLPMAEIGSGQHQELQIAAIAVLPARRFLPEPAVGFAAVAVAAAAAVGEGAAVADAVADVV